MIKINSKVALIVAATVIAAGSLLALNLSKKDKSDTGQSSPKVVQPAGIESADFTYEKPSGWAKLSQVTLDLNDAVSGIGKAPKPAASFTVKVAESVPENDDDLTNSTLTELKKIAKFELIGTTDTKVDGKSGKLFAYQTGEADKIKQELRVIVHNKKTYFLLFTGTLAEFDAQKPDFDKILSTFKFK